MSKPIKRLSKFPPAYSKQAELLMEYNQKAFANYLLRMVSVAEGKPDRKFIKTPEQVLLLGLMGYCREQKKKVKQRLNAEWAVEDLLHELGLDGKGGSNV